MFTLVCYVLDLLLASFGIAASMPVGCHGMKEDLTMSKVGLVSHRHHTKGTISRPDVATDQTHRHEDSGTFNNFDTKQCCWKPAIPLFAELL